MSKKIECRFHDMPYDCCGYIIEFFDSGKEFLNLCRCVQGLYEYTKKYQNIVCINLVYSIRSDHIWPINSAQLVYRLKAYFTDCITKKFSCIKILSLNTSSQLCIDKKIGDLTTLESLNLSSNNIIRIENLNNLVNLKELLLGTNFIKKIRGLDKLSKLEVLVISKNHIKTMTGLENLKNLIVLDLGWNNISKIEGLSTLVKLEELDLSRDIIFSMNIGCWGYGRINNPNPAQSPFEIGSGLKQLKNLKLLNLGGCDVIIIEGLCYSSKLESLDLSFNYIEKIEGLEHLESLKKLRLNDNNITVCEGLDFIADNLTELCLHNNPITSKRGITKFKNLECLTYLNHDDRNSSNYKQKIEIEKMYKIKGFI